MNLLLANVANNNLLSSVLNYLYFIDVFFSYLPDYVDSRAKLVKISEQKYKTL